MLTSQVSNEIQIRDSKKKKEEPLSIETKGSSEVKRLQKKSLRNTPHQSREKSNPHSKSSKKAKQESARSQYYAKYPNSKNGFEGNEYFMSSKVPNGNKKCRRNPVIIKKNYELNRNSEQQVRVPSHSKRKQTEKQTQCVDNLKSPIVKKIKLLSSKGAINFNGEIVRKSRVQSNMFQQISENMASISLEHSQKEKLKIKGKKKQISNEKCRISKSKNKKSKSKDKFQNQKENRLLSEVTDKKNTCEEKKVDIEEVQKQIQGQAQNVIQFVLSNEMIKQRGQCLNMIGKICSSMNLKRQTYALTLYYIDNFIDISTDVKQVKTISISALMMALKIDHAEACGGSGQMSSLSFLQSMTTTKTLSLSIDAKSSEKKKKKSMQKGNQKFNLNRPKLPNVLTTVLSHEQIFSEYNHILCKQEIMDMQMQMMVKLNFKLTILTYSHWIDKLTVLWDRYLASTECSFQEVLFFKKNDSLKNYSYLTQLSEVAYYFPYAYFYSKAVIVLAIMYLISRIRVEYKSDKEEKGFELFKTSLQKSTNIIFFDKMGVNELFGQFLGALKLDLGDIVNCCQYISYYLNHKMLKVQQFEPNKSMNLEQHLSMYQYNPQIFRFFQVKCGNQ